MEKRLAKRSIIILIYLSLLALVAFVIYNALKSEESCFDKIKNQNEEGIDCGGVCSLCSKISAKDIIIEDKGILENGRSNEKDFWALISNPNNLYGAKSFQYEITIKDASNVIVSQRKGTNFILPGEEKYIIENNLSLSESGNNLEFSITKTEWVEFGGYFEKPNLKVVNKNYKLISSGIGFSEATGLLKNESPYDFNIIEIEVILKDSNGKIVAINSTEMRTVRSDEEREFKVFWPVSFSGDVFNVETQPDVNIFESEAILKTVTNGSGNPSK